MLSLSGRIGIALGWLAMAACSGEATITGVGPGPGDGADPTTELRLGSTQDGTFAPGVVQIGLETLAAGGQTSVSVDLVNAQGQRVAGTPLSASFSSNCSASGQSRFEPESVESSAGRFNATYVAQGCNGMDAVTVNLIVDGVVLVAEATLTVAPPELGRLEYVFAETTVIGLLGSPIPNQAEVRFRVRDLTGGLVANQRVDFSLSPSLGGMAVTPAFATTDTAGEVRTVVRGGSIPTAVRVTATVTLPSGQQISTQSEQLAVSTGIPDQNSMSLSADRLAIDGTCDGEPATLSIRLADRFNNPVPEGTAVNFRTAGGAINAACFTGEPNGDPLTEAGVCSALLTVRNPRPANGRVALLATALGEESFVDENGNGFFDLGVDGFPAANDLPEPFLDRNENGRRDAGEEFVDTDASNSYSGPNGRFDGYVCDAPGLNCRTELIHVRDTGIVVFSTARSGVLVECLEAANAICPFTADALAPRSTLDLSFLVSDGNRQVAPTGTTYTLTADEGEILQPATLGPFNTNMNGPQLLSFRYRAPDTAPETARSVTLTLTVNLPASACSGPATLSQFVAELELAAAEEE